jgi:uncharacterized protein YndB with AHSA1/START domain
MPLLFSYGTLQREETQRSTFGRLLLGSRDELPGFEPAQVAIEDVAMRARTGRSHHDNAAHTGRPGSRVCGMAFEVTEAELAAADGYERQAGYVRIEVTLASGTTAWVYIDARSVPVTRDLTGDDDSPAEPRRTTVIRHVKAPRARVYRALLGAHSVQRWRVPTGMTSHVHEFDARVGGAIRVSLTYDAPTGQGKTTRHTDTYHGRFAELVPDERVVEVVEFETTDPALRGAMTITISLADADAGTDVSAVHDGVPAGVPAADNEAGWNSSLAKLAALVEEA